MNRQRSAWKVSAILAVAVVLPPAWVLAQPLEPARPRPVLIDDTDVRPAAAEIELTTNVVYGRAGDEDLTLDLASPKGLTRPVPAVVWIHGGAWRGGRKEEFRQLISDSAKAGYVSASINYRLLPKYAFPAQVEDAKCAVRWLRANAERLHIDPNRIGAVGASAGAHLAMMLGAMDTGDGLEGDGGSPEASSRVQAVVSLAGPTNLQSTFPEASQKLIADFVGGPAAEKPDVAKAASPLTYVSVGDAPMLLVQGTSDHLVPHDQAIQMAEALSKASVPGRIELLLGQGHGLTNERARVLRATFEFLNRHLKP
jgi:acetyl esterase/lipase